MNNHSSCSCGGHACDCCTGPSVLTPETIANPPGLGTLVRRAGTWDSFRQSMIARLSAVTEFPALAGLRTRESDDPSIAFLDAAAVVGDVLTFYNERLANEGYLRTATERRSLTELGKLVGYRPRPGVSASAWLAFSLDAGYAITVPAGTRVQSVPSNPKETAQTFETSSDLAARAELNAMHPRLSIPQEISPANVLNVETIWLQGTGLNLKPGDLLLFVFPADEAASTPRKIHAVTEDQAASRTTVKLVVEKLSAAYYLPVLRKAALAMRAAIDDDWFDDRPWAENVADSLDQFSSKLGADTSLVGMEKLFRPKPGDPADKSLDSYLKAAVAEGKVADALATGLAGRAGWKTDLTAAWQKSLAEAVVTGSPAAIAFVAGRQEDLEDGKIDAAADKILDDNDLDQLIGSSPAAIAAALQKMQTALKSAWTKAETMMRTKLVKGDSEDDSFGMIAEKSATLVDDLPSTNALHKTRATAYESAAAEYTKIYTGDDGESGVKDDVTGVATVGALGEALETQRKHFGSESVSGLKRAISLLAGRYRNLSNPTAAAEIAELAGLAAGNHGLEELAEALNESLEVVSDLVKDSADATLQRLEAEMRILNGQVSVSPSGVSSLSLASTEASSAALGSIVSGTVLQQPAAPGAPLSVPRSLGAFLSVGSDGTSGAASDAVSRLAGRLAGSTDDELFDAWRKLNTGTPAVEIHAMRVQSAVFGAGAPMRFGTAADTSFDARFSNPAGSGDWAADFNDLGSVIRLDGEHGKVVRDGWIVIERPQTVESANSAVSPIFLSQPAGFGGAKAFGGLAFGFPILDLNFLTFSFFRPDEVTQTLVRRVSDVQTAPHSAYSLSGKATTVSLLQETSWGADSQLGFGVIRRTKVYAASELLALGEMPVDREFGRPLEEGQSLARTAENPFAETGDVLVLDGLYQGLAPGHRLILSGQRADSVSERQVREYALVSKIEHVLTPAAADPSSPLPGDTPHTRLTLSKEMQYVYRRGTVTIYGNVAEATHGETKREVLGSGNARAASQAFPLRSVPVTHVAAATAKGAASTVQLRVDKILWTEADQFTGSGPDDRVYVVEIAEDGSTRAVFGDGKQGARLTTGAENVTAVYRTGIGKGGNVGAESLSTLLDRPLGLKGVVNPLSASGGADRDGPEDIRRNAPLPLVALDRLVSVSDYAAFSRAFAGIGKAESLLLDSAGGSFVHVTIAGKDDVPIDETSSLLASLTEALVNLGDPLLPVRVQPRELLVLLLAANVRIDVDRDWADVEPAIRAAVLAAFGFSKRKPGQDVFLSQVIAVIQTVPGVDFVDVDSFAGIPQKRASKDGRISLTPAELEAAVRGGILAANGQPISPPNRLSTQIAGFDAFGALRPAQIAMFLPDLPETLILNQIVP